MEETHETTAPGRSDRKQNSFNSALPCLNCDNPSHSLQHFPHPKNNDKIVQRTREQAIAKITGLSVNSFDSPSVSWSEMEARAARNPIVPGMGYSGRGEEKDANRVVLEVGEGENADTTSESRVREKEAESESDVEAKETKAGESDPEVEVKKN